MNIIGNSFEEDGTVPAWKRQRFERQQPLCETCTHYIKSHQLASNTFTRPMCKQDAWGNIPSLGYCDKHQHIDSLWDDAYLRSLVPEFIKEDEMRI